MGGWMKFQQDWWDTEIGTELYALGSACFFATVFIINSPRAHPSGLFNFSPADMVGRIPPHNPEDGDLYCEGEVPAMSLREATETFQKLIDAKILKYDRKQRVTYVPWMAGTQFGEKLLPKDNRLPNLHGHVKNFLKSPFLREFMDAHGQDYLLQDVWKAMAVAKCPSKMTSDGLDSSPEVCADDLTSHPGVVGESPRSHLDKQNKNQTQLQNQISEPYPQTHGLEGRGFGLDSDTGKAGLESDDLDGGSDLDFGSLKEAPELPVGTHEPTLSGGSNPPVKARPVLTFPPVESTVPVAAKATPPRTEPVVVTDPLPPALIPVLQKYLKDGIPEVPDASTPETVRLLVLLYNYVGRPSRWNDLSYLLTQATALSRLREGSSFERVCDVMHWVFEEEQPKGDWTGWADKIVSHIKYAGPAQYIAGHFAKDLEPQTLTWLAKQKKATTTHKICDKGAQVKDASKLTPDELEKANKAEEEHADHIFDEDDDE